MTGLFFKANHAPFLIHLDHPEGACFLDGHAQCRDGQGGRFLLVEAHHLAHVHLVDVIGAEDADVLGVGDLDEAQVLINGVCGAVIPAFAHSHLGRNGIDEAIRDADDVPALLHVQVEGLGLELGEHIDAQEVGVDEVVEHEVDQPVTAAKGHGGFAAGGGQRLQSGTFTACQYHGEYACHRRSLPEIMMLKRFSCCCEKNTPKGVVNVFLVP